MDAPAQPVHTSVMYTLLVPRTRTAIGQRSFAINGLRTWNSLPADLRTPDTTLKANLFQQ